MLGQYQLTTPLSNKDAGSCSWCFAVRDGRDYFIKEFMDPKYPEGDTASSPEKREKKRKKCLKFEEKKTRVYKAINDNSDGIAVRVTDFFRVGAKYYAVMPKIENVKMDTEEVARLPSRTTRSLCAMIAHAVAQLHKGGFIHADLKHTNVMLTHSSSGALTAKLIDYDAGYFEDDPPTHSEEIGGDQVYFAPEVYRAINGESVALTRSLDIFSLGVLFHQYLTGTLPVFDMVKYSCVGEAVACNETIVAAGLPRDLQSMIEKMLSPNPSERPTAQSVYETLIAPLRPHDTIVPVADTGYAASGRTVNFNTGISDFVGDAPAEGGWNSLGDL